MNIAIAGCGYVADSYLATLADHPELALVGAFDRDQERLDRFAGHWATHAYSSVEALIEDPRVELVLNLTNPRSHYEVTRACLEGAKHVYSEKPLAMCVEQAAELVGIARARGLYLSSAPCSALSETAQTLWKAIRENAVGRIRLVYANFDDGMVGPNMKPWTWVSASGAPWPARDEFEVGCAFEHAGYVLTWLAAFFGPAVSLTAFASCRIPDKGVSRRQHGAGLHRWMHRVRGRHGGARHLRSRRAQGQIDYGRWRRWRAVCRERQERPRAGDRARVEAVALALAAAAAHPVAAPVAGGALPLARRRDHVPADLSARASTGGTRGRP